MPWATTSWIQPDLRAPVGTAAATGSRVGTHGTEWARGVAPAGPPPATRRPAPKARAPAAAPPPPRNRRRDSPARSTPSAICAPPVVLASPPATTLRCRRPELGTSGRGLVVLIRRANTPVRAAHAEPAP